MKRIMILSITLLSAVTQPALAEGYDKPYDAVYDQITTAGTNTLRLSCDGQGHLRTESTLGGRSLVTINDMKNKVGYTIDDFNRRVSRVPLNDAPGAPPVDDSQKISLGTRLVDGRTCEGWEFRRNGHTSQTWVDPDIGCCVVSIYDGKVQMRLKVATKTALAPIYFSLPANYPVIDMNQQIHQAQDHAKRLQSRRQH
ncbi:MAG: hypothetical protein K2X93_24200 [Candidatus Obscuribacterales bacterium]|nr:hypothetical protein [Candidatus Obscuribacterales bacterium]